MIETPKVTVSSLVKELGLSGYYPDSWDGFIGQTQAKRMLKVAAASARKRNKPCEHVLLKGGTPGIGKTTLGLLMSAELGKHLRLVSGKVTVQQARFLLSEMEDGDVLLWDEIHMAVVGGKSNAEWLLPFLEQGVIIGPHGPEDTPNITVIGATTDAGRLPEAILSRFTKQPDLVEYSDIEAEFISTNMAQSIFGLALPWPGSDVHEAIARAANRNPRMIRTILVNLRDLAIAEDMKPEDGDYDLTEVFEWIGLTEDGLTKQAQEYLLALKQTFGGKAGATAMKERLREPGGLAYTERLLMDKGYIVMGTGGRNMTGAGIKRVRLLEQEIDAA